MKEKYIKEALPALKKEFGYNNNLAAPRIIKVVLNTGFNPSIKEEKAQEELIRDLSLIAGQKPVYKKAKKAIAGFKTREGMPIGLSVALRGRLMYDFLDRLVNVALPRGRDFQGLPSSNVDQAGNLNIGIKEHIIFPEISTESAKNIFGFQITVVTTADNKKQGLALFKLLGFPIKSKA